MFKNREWCEQRYLVPWEDRPTRKSTKRISKRKETLGGYQRQG